MSTASCAQLRDASHDADVRTDRSEFEEAWRLYLRQKEAIETLDGRRAQRGTLAMLDRCFQMLEGQGLVRRERDAGDNPPYVPMERLRLMVGTVAGDYAFEQLQRLRREQQEGA